MLIATDGLRGKLTASKARFLAETWNVAFTKGADARMVRVLAVLSESRTLYSLLSSSSPVVGFRRAG